MQKLGRQCHWQAAGSVEVSAQSSVQEVAKPCNNWARQRGQGHQQEAECVKVSVISKFQEVAKPCNNWAGRAAKATGRGLRLCNCQQNLAFRRWQSHATTGPAEQPGPLAAC